MTSRANAIAFAVLSASLLTAQNEIVFVGTSVGGTTDPFFFAASGTGTVVSSGGNNSTDNVTDAVWMDLGTNLYLSRSLAGNNLSRGQWNGTSATWSTFYATNNACYGLGADRARQRLWVLTGATGSTRELVCLDANPASASYGQVITQTTTLSGVSRERWELSRSGNLAAVPHAFLSGGLFQIVDTNPGSPTFLQVLISSPVSGAGGGFTIASDCAISGDDLFAYVLYTGLGTQGLAVMFIPTGTWLDFDPVTPGQQDFAIALPVPNLMDLSPYGYSPVVSGQGGAGWAARIDLDPFNPQNTTLTQFNPGPALTSCDGASLSADGRRMAVTITSPPSLIIIDVPSGMLLQNVPLPGASNIYTTAWQDLRSNAAFTTYGSGCAGSLGVPTLSAAGPPRLGTVFQLLAGNVPGGAFFVAGTSNTTSGPFTLPLNLASYGMPGCFLLTQAANSVFQIGGSWAFGVPNNPLYLGFTFYSQVFAFDAPANPLGITTSNGGRAVVGL